MNVGEWVCVSDAYTHTTLGSSLSTPIIHIIVG